MADWRDGAEYAPIERPDGFATPRTEPLEAPPPRNDLAAGAPQQAPDGFQPSQVPTPPLDRLVPAAGPQRNPHEAFDSGAAMSGDGSAAWGAAHAHAGPTFNPRAPMAVVEWNPDQPLGAPQSVSAFAPPSGAPVPAAWGPPTGPSAPGVIGVQGPQQPPATGGRAVLTDIVRVIGLAGWPLFIALLLGVIFHQVSMIALLASIFFATRAKVAKSRLQQFTAIGAVIAVFGGVAFNPNQDAVAGLNTWARIMCAVLLLVCYLFAAQSSKQTPPR